MCRALLGRCLERSFYMCRADLELGCLKMLRRRIKKIINCFFFSIIDCAFEDNFEVY
jgi:hypothetical protein